MNIDNAMLEWTGHPLIDISIATLCAMCKKNSPAALTMEDLDHAADEMAAYYFSGLMSSYNSCVFTMNAYDNPTAGPEKKKAYEDKYLRAHRAEPESAASGLFCPFSGREATHLIERRQMPMLTGEGVLNFYPAGRGFLPIFGPYLVALQALPLGGRRTEGRLLLAHADDNLLTLEFARKYLEDNLRLINLAKSSGFPTDSGPVLELEREQSAGTVRGRTKFPDAKAPSSLIAHDLMEIYRTRAGTGFSGRADISLTVYWLSNSGQGAALDIFHIPSQVTRFLRNTCEAKYRAQWTRVVRSGWREPSKQKTKPSGISGGPGRSRNDVLTDLFAIYANGFIDYGACNRFLRHHLLNVDYLQEPEDTPKADWELTELFLKEVMGVDQQRIEAVKGFADRLASHISQSNDRGLFRNLVYAQRSWEVRNALTKAQRNQAKDHGDLLFGLDEFVRVFEADDAVGRMEWNLIRDLISIRLVEELHNRGFFAKEENADLLAGPETQNESAFAD